MRVCNFLLFAVVVLVHVNAQPTETESEQVRLPQTESSFKTSSGRYLRVLQAKDNDAIEERGFNFNFPWLKKLEKFIPGTRANKAAAAAKAKAISEKKAVEGLAKAKQDDLYKTFAQGERDGELFKMFKTWKNSKYSPAQAERMMTDAIESVRMRLGSRGSSRSDSEVQPQQLKHFDGDMNLATALEKATTNPSTAVLAEKIQQKQFKVRVEDGVQPNTFLSSVFNVHRATDEQNAIAAKFKTYYDSAKKPGAFVDPRRF
ncbi:hypothetical protein ON010_g6536 [Phytophthora cinnamomi]|nr:hypothetical protein ON010_g6536 [Phytophthora cinnamomi]